MRLRRKPEGWPKLMVAKRLKSGATAYYWDPPTWSKKFITSFFCAPSSPCGWSSQLKNLRLFSLL